MELCDVIGVQNTEMKLEGSFEFLKAKENSIVILETFNIQGTGINNGIPIFGYRNFGTKTFYYLNVCQHSCLTNVQSPLQTSLGLYKALERIFKWIYERQRNLGQIGINHYL
jgi:hypothetical protein